MDVSEFCIFLLLQGYPAWVASQQGREGAEEEAEADEEDEKAEQRLREERARAAELKEERKRQRSELNQKALDFSDMVSGIQATHRAQIAQLKAEHAARAAALGASLSQAQEHKELTVARLEQEHESVVGTQRSVSAAKVA